MAEQQMDLPFGRVGLHDAALRPQPKRDGPDDWPTPACLLAALTQDVLPTLPVDLLWEPAPGGQVLADALRRAGYRVHVTEEDFLACPVPREVGGLVTNPPFNMHSGFIKRSLSLLDAGALQF